MHRPSGNSINKHNGFRRTTPAVKPTVKPRQPTPEEIEAEIIKPARTPEQRKADRTRKPAKRKPRGLKPKVTVKEETAKKPARRYVRVTDEILNKFLDAVRLNNGNVSVACSISGISWSNVTDYKLKHREFRESLEHAIAEGQKDFKNVLIKGRNRLLIEGLENLLQDPPDRRDDKRIALFINKINDSLGITGKTTVENNINTTESSLYKDVKIKVVKPEKVLQRIKDAEAAEKERLENIMNQGTDAATDDEDYYDPAPEQT